MPDYSKITKRNQGKDFNFFLRQAVSSGSYGTNPDVVIPFPTKGGGIILAIEGTGTISYSCNGNTDHGELTNGGNRQQITFSSRTISTLWLRVKSGSNLSIIIDAWA